MKNNRTPPLSFQAHSRLGTRKPHLQLPHKGAAAKLGHPAKSEREADAVALVGAQRQTSSASASPPGVAGLRKTLTKLWSKARCRSYRIATAILDIGERHAHPRRKSGVFLVECRQALDARKARHR